MSRAGNWSRAPSGRVNERALKLQFFYLGEIGTAPPVMCFHQFPFGKSRNGMAKAVQLSDAQLEGPTNDKDRLSQAAQQKLAEYLGFDIDWKEWIQGSALEFAARYNSHQESKAKAGLEPGESTSIDDLLAGLSLWLGQDVTTSPDGAPLWPVSFEFRSQPSPGVVPGRLIVLRRVKIFVFAEGDGGDTALWQETYPKPYEPEGSNVILQPLGTNVRPGRLVEAKPGCYIANVNPPNDFYRVSGLVDGSVINAYAAAYVKDLEDNAIDDENRPMDGGQQRESIFSFLRVKDDKPVELLSNEQARLLQILAIKERQYDKRQKVQAGWVFLDWVKRKPFFATHRKKD